jgi:pimeloyl-ACP methyl ester carboxylesterase
MGTNGKHVSWSEETTAFGGIDLVVRKTGSGAPLLVLHEELGDPGSLSWQDELGSTRTLLEPLHPGFGRSPRLDWIASVRDLAAFYAAHLRARGGAPIDVLGFSFGGWIAAEMIALDPTLFRRAVLVAPPGIRPPEGEIFDLFTVTAQKFVQRSVLDPAATPEFRGLFGGDQTPEQFEAWEDARAEVARLAWQPYMFDPALPHLLELAAAPPTLVVAGRDDPIVPRSVAEAYAKAIAGAKLVLLDRCGHRPEIEARDAFVREVANFLS